ncbi:Fc.00g028610.m01.CDS01 [Cosmosporella sp. VM-42]
MRSMRLSRLPGRVNAWSAKRCYSVRVPGECQKDIKTVADLKAWGPGTHVSQVEVSGWVRSVRKSSGVRFIDITDGSSMRPVQVVVDKALAADMRPGAAVRLKGTWRDDSHQSISSATSSDIRSGEAVTSSVLKTSTTAELQVAEVEVLGPSDPQVRQPTSKPLEIFIVTRLDVRSPSLDDVRRRIPSTYPIQNKYQTPESLRTISHLRSRTPLNSTMLRLRSDATALLTQFFFKEKYQQCHPPIITSSDCEGAGEAFAVKAGGDTEFFRDPKYLTVSSQLHLESLAQALGNVWTLSPTFRAEQSDTSRHLSEFYMLEVEMSFVEDMDEVMDLAQRMLTSLARGLKELSAATELEKNRLDSKDPAERLAYEDLVDQEQLDRRWRGLLVTERWPRITYNKAIELLQPVADRFEHKPVWGAGLQSEHEKYLAEEVGFDKATNAYVPIFITQYPREIKAFYMRQSATSPPEGITVDCFDLLVPNLGELAGGSMREHRLSHLEDNMRVHGLEVPSKRSSKGSDMAWYLDLRRWGCPPHGGFGLGFDRLLSYLTGVPNVRDVVPFPRHYERCDC